LSDILGKLEETFGDRVRVFESLGQTVVHVAAGEISSVVTFLKSQGFSMLIDLSAVDYLGREPRFDVVYHLYHVEHRQWLRLIVQVGGDEPQVPSISHVFASANWAERECYDLVGIRFRGHPDLKRILMPDDWEGHPLRKDYPLTGTEPPPPLARE
jgi:NADH-quinone oxidoreductase subunit C